ncbi:unnamed protein product [Adineta steineri]|uniref:Uncharacterized protein n=1 Tax=Adineta steineri TaxID=433720 RepID=A0A814L9U0_9BILA|nr:unnamed protein product [Adineta steineri]CAF1010125.1 unnamed protein product [Adineta steineri]CAF1062142.1 unnamed protein product [Adineta steineri]
MPKISLNVSIKTYWLAIKGRQSTINENPSTISKADLTTDSLDLEQHIFYTEITEVCVSSEEQKRHPLVIIYEIVLHEYFLETFHNERLPLVIDYGVLDGLCEMDQKIIGELVFPIIRALGDQIVKSCENPLLSPIDKITIARINGIISKYIPTAYRATLMK